MYNGAETQTSLVLCLLVLFWHQVTVRSGLYYYLNIYSL